MLDIANSYFLFKMKQVPSDSMKYLHSYCDFSERCTVLLYHKYFLIVIIYSSLARIENYSISSRNSSDWVFKI